MESDRVIHTFQKNPDEEIRLTIRPYKDRYYLDLRLWFRPSGGGECHPTKKGLTVGLEHLQELRKGLERADKVASEMALHEPSNSVK